MVFAYIDMNQPWVYMPCLLFKKSVIGGNLLYNIVLVSAAQQCRSVISVHVSPPCWASRPSLPSGSSQNARPGSLCDTATSHQLSVLHTVGVYAMMLLSPFTALFPSPTVGLLTLSSIALKPLYLFLLVKCMWMGEIISRCGVCIRRYSFIYSYSTDKHSMLTRC